MEPALAIQEFLEYVVGGLVEHPDEIEIEREDRSGVNYFLVQIHPDDTGRVIGKSGKTICAIRSLIQASAQKHRILADVEVVTPGRE
jgi:predicted RNA-binding protein YlqC (UPF0109 family)